jgi:hypothetical protein
VVEKDRQYRRLLGGLDKDREFLERLKADFALPCAFGDGASPSSLKAVDTRLHYLEGRTSFWKTLEPHPLNPRQAPGTAPKSPGGGGVALAKSPGGVHAARVTGGRRVNVAGKQGSGGYSLHGSSSMPTLPGTGGGDSTVTGVTHTRQSKGGGLTGLNANVDSSSVSAGMCDSVPFLSSFPPSFLPSFLPFLSFCSFSHSVCPSTLPLDISKPGTGSGLQTYIIPTGAMTLDDYLISSSPSRTVSSHSMSKSGSLGRLSSNGSASKGKGSSSKRSFPPLGY